MPPRAGARRAARGLASWLATAIGAAALVLLLVHLAPGDAIDLVPGGEALRPQLEAEFGLDRPLWARLVRSLAGILTGDWGRSVAYRPGASVREVIAGPALRSGGLLAGATLLALVQALGLAWFTRARSPAWGLAARALSVAPVFLLAHLAIHGLNEGAFALITAGWIDRPGWFALPDRDSALRTALAVGLLATGSATLTELHVEIGAALARIEGSTFVDAARARGQPTWPLVLPNLVPVLASLLARRIAFLVGSLVILERVLLLNGAGALLWRAAMLRDQPVAVGVAVLAAGVVATARLAADGLRLAVDPRLRALEDR